MMTVQPFPNAGTVHPLIALGISLLMSGSAPLVYAWEAYGGDPGGSKFSPLTQINRDNVHQLIEAWVYQSGETGVGYSNGLTFEATPVFWRDTLFFNSSFGKAYAVDAATGKERWRFDAGFAPDERFDETAARGVSLWHGDDPTAVCNHRVLFGTLRGHLHALDALTGQPCKDFGDDGVVDLTIGVGEVEPGSYTITSPPAIIHNTLYIGSAIGDNRKIDSERGIVRALDILEGQVLWSWDPIPRSATDPARQTWQGNSADISGGGNAWAPLSVDVERQLVFVPTSAASPDFYGGHRAGDNHYTSSVVALNGRNGEVVWHQQLVHHDVWDYDTPAQPVLVDVDLGNGSVPALLQVTKTGMLYVFDRRSGEPLVAVEERPVATNGVTGERLAATQPFSTLPPLASQRAITPADAFGVAFFDKRACAKRIAQYRSEGIFTPPSLAGTLMNPGYAGGVNWGGVGVDAESGLAVSFVNELPAVVRLVPRAEFDPDKRTEGFDASRMDGTPYVMERAPFLSALGLPCTKPPWGKLVAVDLRRREIAWSTPLGTIADLAPAAVPNFAWGVPGMGGPLLTAGRLVFIGAAAENTFRAIDLLNGRELWQGDLPRAGMASPMTYSSGGKQYVVIAAGGHAHLTDQTGDFLVAFALPD
ncbi:MAG: pyrroloquinoline quinone-dependent dehydrogenase [bacterium]